MSTPPDEQHEQSPWSRLRRADLGRFRLLALILAGILVATSPVAAATTTRTAQPDSPPPARRHPPVTPLAPPPARSPGSKPFPPAAPPVGTRWATVGSMQVPQAPNLYDPNEPAVSSTPASPTVPQAHYSPPSTYGPRPRLLTHPRSFKASRGRPQKPRQQQPAGRQRTLCSSRDTDTTPTRPRKPRSRS